MSFVVVQSLSQWLLIINFSKRGKKEEIICKGAVCNGCGNSYWPIEV